MNYGNVSLFLDRACPLSLAPTYDMVPMQYRPDIEGHFSSDPVSPVPPFPEAMSVWMQATVLAGLFWARLASSDIVSKGFRELASRNVNVVAEYKRSFL
jgi:hypothetical protein